MHGALGMVGRELVVLAHVDEVEPLATVQLGLHLGDRAFFDVRLCFFNQFQKPRIVLHRSLTYSIPQAYLSLSLPEHSAEGKIDRKSTRLNSSHGYISYAVFCLKKKKKIYHQRTRNRYDT